MKIFKVGDKMFQFFGMFLLPRDFNGSTSDALRLIADHIDDPNLPEDRTPFPEDEDPSNGRDAAYKAFVGTDKKTSLRQCGR